ncbi:adenine nucleotide transporter BT1, chloroplastic/mitochondrial-like [Juglans microcarpa x Juglans regia]|uniref:adenine nucleotide transporter BT1, chloroplastic/mitochondrial-like n=1 Tax=Juglans microcarpa x Juglans regia TaxID=2249226 RepID=UPI001B7F24E6|nr:adenine nucleotide transporter BT1, chloroplastic/mitochondrial-like [Juglans microcarpa x Juglans regia]XP_041004964.1 adenine nucleotide transporter BT1, chloroplastic/mitochondrial-like [Juglans microcarpa x Juglans regia]
MGRRGLQSVAQSNKDVVVVSSGIKIQCYSQEGSSCSGGLFASVGQAGLGFGIPSNPQSPKDEDIKSLCGTTHMIYLSMPESRFGFSWIPESVTGEALEVGEDELMMKKKKKMRDGLKLKIKIGNPSMRRLVSGAIAGAVSRTVVAPLETIRTHVMVGSLGHSTTEVFQNIMETDGWKGLFKGNFVNIIRVAPSKAIELFAFDTVKKHLTPKPGIEPKSPIPASLIAGAVAGVSSTLATYPLELLKTRITVQRGVYKNLLDALFKIVKEEGPAELYRGLTPSVIGVIPYTAANYFAYDTLRKAYKKAFKKEEIGSIMTLLIGSASGAISSTATFPLEVARRHMQAAGAINGRQYQSMLHALLSILEHEGLRGLYRGLGPSCMKLVPAAGISFMCYEACKRLLIEKEEDN